MHIPVLLHETIEGLNLQKGAVVVDGTLGAGGHASAIAERFGSEVKIIGFDLDRNAIAIAEKRVLDAGGNLTVINANFRYLDTKLPEIGVIAINGALFDLGVSSMELGQSGRGFSFKYDEPLLMTLESNPDESTITARDLVNSSREEDLATIIFNYGEEHYSRRIAKAIVEARRKKKIETSLELADIIAGSVPAGYRNGRINPATKTFQALRIATNDELGAVRDGLKAAWTMLAPGGRIAVITFHSLEDRIVKNYFKELSQENGLLLTKKPIVPGREEIITNPRSRSAKLRIIEKKK